MHVSPLSSKPSWRGGQTVVVDGHHWSVRRIMPQADRLFLSNGASLLEVSPYDRRHARWDGERWHLAASGQAARPSP